MCQTKNILTRLQKDNKNILENLLMLIHHFAKVISIFLDDITMKSKTLSLNILITETNN